MDLLGLPVRWPIIGAPMAGGPSTPALAAAVCNAGGLGFLAGGYRTAEALGDEISELRALTRAPFGVNVFVPQGPTLDELGVIAYLAGLRAEADRFGVDLQPTWDDDGWQDKLDLLVDDPVPVVSFTFGCPAPEVVSLLRDAGSRVVITVTSPVEAHMAVDAGADAVVGQGTEAGGHQATFDDGVPLESGMGAATLVPAIRRTVDVPLIAAGGLVSGAHVAAVVAMGAVAAQVGTALLRSPESGAHAVHKAALIHSGFDGTAMTRAFSGRRARGLVNRFMRAHPDAPSAYPEINNATRALRRAALHQGDPHTVNLWAGTGYARSEDRPAGEIITRMGIEFDGIVRAAVHHAGAAITPISVPPHTPR
ncbi:MAG: nitronate monooxygenase [Acidimicrobiales bacterium]|nr:nitronate monooxygenase [Acidimicrobiales bacterium]